MYNVQYWTKILDHSLEDSNGTLTLDSVVRSKVKYNKMKLDQDLSEVAYVKVVDYLKDTLKIKVIRRGESATGPNSGLGGGRCKA